MTYFIDSKHENPKMQMAHWAANLMNGHLGEWCILDTETTGLYKPEIIDICILSKYGSPMLNTRLKPKQKIEDEAAHIHGCTNESLEDMPSFPSIRDRIQEITKDKTVVIYNADFDTAALFHTCKIHQLPRITFKSACAMFKYARFYGQWSNYYGNYKWQKLPNGDHSAYGDCKAVYKLIKLMADYAVTGELPPLPKPQLFPPKQIALKWEPKFTISINKYRSWGVHRQYYEKIISMSRFYWMTDDNKEDK